jgi:Protein required for attachment to host cells
MPVKNKPTWILVMDGTEARFFVLRKGEEGQVFEEAMLRLSGAEQKPSRSDKPGRFVSPLGGHHAGQAKTTPQKQEVLALTRRVAGILEEALNTRQFEFLVLVAPARHITELREQLSPKLLASVAHQIPKNFAALPTDVLWEKLSAILLKAAKPVMSAPSRSAAAGGQVPVSVVFRGMDSSQTVEAEAAKYAAKLGKKYARIQTCRVTVEAPKHEHRKVRAFRVAVAMKLPGREIATKPAEGAGHVDLSAAMREAFAAAARLLESHVRSFKETVMRERRRSSPRMRGLAQA